MWAVSYIFKIGPLITPSLHIKNTEEEARELYETAKSLPKCDDPRMWQQVE